MYGVTELVAVGLAWQLLGIARAGDDLAQAGMTAYMFDVVYLTWFVHVGTALVSARLWRTYAVIPAYLLYLAYKNVLPYVWPQAHAAAAPQRRATRR